MKPAALPQALTAKETHLKLRICFPATLRGAACLLAAPARHIPAGSLMPVEGEGEKGSYSRFTNETPRQLAPQRTFICPSGLNELLSPLLKLAWKLSSFLDTNDSLETSSPTSLFILSKERNEFSGSISFLDLSLHSQSQRWKKQSEGKNKGVLATAARFCSHKQPSQVLST